MLAGMRLAMVSRARNPTVGMRLPVGGRMLLRPQVRPVPRRTLNARAGHGGGGIGVGGVLVGATTVVGGAVALGSWYLNVSVSDWQYILGLKKVNELVPRAAEVIQLPEMVAPDEYIHPYSQRSWLWQWSFTIQRSFYLIYLALPLGYHTIRLLLAEGDIAIRDRWCKVLINFLNDAGCSFQKFGQWLSMRPDIFPEWLVEALGELRQEAPVHPYQHTVMVIEEALGMQIDEIFESIEPTPVASGSVGQVHRAVLKEKYALADGTTDVAVKVRHPAVLDETYIDFKLVYNTIPMINVLLTPLSSTGTSLAMPFAADSLINTIQKQLDFKWEAYNLLEFCHNFAREMQEPLEEDDIRISFPIVSTQLLADAVLIESWAPGKTVANVYGDVKAKGGKMSKKLANTILEVTIKMFLRDNFIHGDLHAGNLLWDEESRILTVMDAGLVTHLPGDVWNEFGDFIRALCTKDILEIRDKLIFFHDEKVVGGRPRDEIDPVYLERDVADIYLTGGGSDRGPDIPLAQALGDIVGDVLRRVGKHGIVLRADVASAICSISVAEGVIFQLDPKLDVLKTALPYFVKYQGWDSAEDILSASYFSSERKAKDLVTEMAKKVSDVRLPPNEDGKTEHPTSDAPTTNESK
eukprot:m.58482 g.58482  ORF g.58482 m.58482 type:complete len:637 (-) comp7825_c0_seq1:3466-5376(-)